MKTKIPWPMVHRDEDCPLLARRIVCDVCYPLNEAHYTSIEEWVVAQYMSALLAEAREVPGGYWYSGAASEQLCFPLRAGGELRFIQSEDGDGQWHIDHYDGMIPPGVSGPAGKTGPNA